MSPGEPNSAAPLLVLGSKNYSSWSLRPWLFLRKVGFDFRETVIQFDAGDYQAQIAALSQQRFYPAQYSEQWFFDVQRQLPSTC